MTARRTILVVDDEYSVVESLTDILELEGYAVLSAANGARALAIIERTPPDAILLDYMMPVMDGIELMEAMEERGLAGRIPVLMMTAAPLGLPKDPKLRRWTALLPKPFELGDLLKTLAQLLEERKP